MAQEEKNIVGSIEFLEVVGLEGSTYKLQGPNGEEVKLNQSEVNEEDELTIGENIVSSFILIDQVHCLRHKTCQTLLLANMIL